ncbi:MAG: FtsX-like permease family protein [Lachnospiraceae bacterium]|nr:FtsX-like permease family protein [Lachnospiraceae bacterium]
MEKLSSLTLRYLKFNIKRTITTCIGVIISTVLMYMIFTIGYSTFYSQAEEKFYEYHLGYDAILVCDGETAREIVKLAPYYSEQSDKDIDVKLSYAWVAAPGNRDIIYVNDFFAMPRQFHMAEGTLPKNENSIISSYSKAEFLNEKAGDIVELAYEKDGKDYAETKIISGIYKDDFSFNEEDTGYRLLFFNGGNFTLYGDKIYDLDEVCVFVTFDNKEDIRGDYYKLTDKFDLIDSHLSDESVKLHNPEDSLGYLTAQALLMIFAFFGAVASIFIIRNAFNISVHERNRDYGLLRCVGMSRRQIIGIIVREAFIISIIGLIIGIALGHGLCVLGFGVFKNVLELSDYYRIRLIPIAWIFTIVAVIVTTAYAMVAPVEKLYKLNPINALRMTDEYRDNKIDKLKAKHKRGRLFTKFLGVEIGYAYKNALRNKGRFIISVVTLTVCSALFVGIYSAFSLLEKNYKRLWGLECEYSGEIFVNEYKDLDYLINKCNEFSEVEDTMCYVGMSAKIKNSEGDDIDIKFIGVEDEEYKRILALTGDYKATSQNNAIEGIVSADSSFDVGEVYALGRKYGNLSMYVSSMTKDNYELSSELNRFIESGVNISYEGKPVELFIYNMDSNNYHINRIYNTEDSQIYDFTTGEDDYISYYYHFCVKLNPKKSHRNFDNFIKTSPYEYYSYTEDYDSARNMMMVARAIATVVIIILLIMYMVNIINISSSEMIIRRNELNTLRAIGMSIRQQSRMLYAESIIIALISSVLGAVIGVICSWYIVNIMLMVWGEIHFTIKWSVIIGSTIILVGINIFNVWMSKPDGTEILALGDGG